MRQTPPHTYRMLVAAVVLQAIEDHFENIRQFGMKSAQNAEARNWIMSDSIQPFSFLWCCSHLDLQPKKLRETLNDRRLVSDARDRLRQHGARADGQALSA